MDANGNSPAENYSARSLQGGERTSLSWLKYYFPWFTFAKRIHRPAYRTHSDLMLSRIWNSAQGVLKPSAAPISDPQPGTPMATTRRKGVAATKLIDDHPSPNTFFTPAESRSAMKKRRRNASLESLEVPNTDSPGVKRQKLPARGKDTDASMENTEDVAAESPKPVDPVAKPKSTHKRFDDDDAETTAPAPDLVQESAEAKNKDEDEEEDESSDDDAPEEVTVDVAAQTVKKAAREAARLREE